MSTKIYNGYRIDNIGTFAQLDIFRQELIKIAKDTQTKIATRLAIQTSIRMLDLYTVGFDVPDINQKVFHYGYHQTMDRFRKFNDGQYRDPPFDLRFEVVLFLKNPMLAIFIGDNPEMRQAFEQHNNVTHYPYWNNTDPPEDVTDLEWEHRKLHWEFLEGAICDYGWIISVSGARNPGFIVEEQFFPKEMVTSFEDRCRTVARSILLHRVDTGVYEVPNMPDSENKNAVDIANAIYKWLEEGEGSKLIEEEVSKVFLVLNKHLSYKDIFESTFSTFARASQLG